MKQLQYLGMDIGGVKKNKEKQRNEWFKCQISCSSGDQ